MNTAEKTRDLKNLNNRQEQGNYKQIWSRIPKNRTNCQKNEQENVLKALILTNRFQSFKLKRHRKM